MNDTTANYRYTPSPLSFVASIVLAPCFLLAGCEYPAESTHIKNAPVIGDPVALHCADHGYEYMSNPTDGTATCMNPVNGKTCDATALQQGHCSLK